MRFIAVAIVIAAVLMPGTVRTSVAATGGRATTIDWQQRDTALYVVSSLNVLHVSPHRTLEQTLRRRLGVVSFEVWNDVANADLFVIQAKRADGSVAGEFAYQMGWIKAEGLSSTMQKLGIPAAADSLASALASDQKQLIGSFTTTVPR